MAINSKKPSSISPPDRPITREVLAAIADSGLTDYAIAQATGVNTEVIRRFRLGQRDIKLETLDRLAATLGIRIVRAARTRGRPAKGE